MNWSDLKTLFYEMTGDNESSPMFFSEAAVQEYANSALRDLVRQAQILEKRRLTP